MRPDGGNAHACPQAEFGFKANPKMAETLKTAFDSGIPFIVLFGSSVRRFLGHRCGCVVSRSGSAHRMLLLQAHHASQKPRVQHSGVQIQCRQPSWMRMFVNNSQG